MSVKRLEFMVVTDADREPLNPFVHRAAPEDPPGPFRIGELSRLSGVAVGTIKFYLREGLLPAGEATSKTQALYTTDHLRRLRVVGVLAEVGGLSIAQIRKIAGLLDGEPAGSDGFELSRAVSYALPRAGRTAPEAPLPPEEEAAAASAREATDAFLDMLGFVVDPEAPARADLGDALLALRTLGFADNPIVFYDHARLAYELAQLEMSSTAAVTDRAAIAEAITVGSVIFGSAFMALRRLAHEHEVHVRIEEGEPVAGLPAEPPAEAGPAAEAP